MAFAWTGVNSFHPARLMPSCNFGGRSVMDASGNSGSCIPVSSGISKFWINTQGFLSPSIKKAQFSVIKKIYIHEL